MTLLLFLLPCLFALLQSPSLLLVWVGRIAQATRFAVKDASVGECACREGL